jgi:hypothetical protein
MTPAFARLHDPPGPRCAARPSGRRSTLAPAALLLGSVVALAACATSAGSQPQAQNPIVIPDGAAAVKQIYLFDPEKWARLNDHMALVWSQSKPYLLVADERCPNLARPTGAVVRTNQHETALHANTMVLVDGAPCLINRIYSVTEEDCSTLRTLFGR